MASIPGIMENPAFASMLSLVARHRVRLADADARPRDHHHDARDDSPLANANPTSAAVTTPPPTTPRGDRGDRAELDAEIETMRRVAEAARAVAATAASRAVEAGAETETGAGDRDRSGDRRR